MIGRFLSLYPAVTLEVIAEDTFIDVFAAGFDAGIRYDESLERDMIRIPLGPRQQRYVTAAAPAYLAARGLPAHPHDLLEHACIRHRFASGVTAGWEFERGGETIRIVPKGPLVATTAALELSAAVQGLGLIHTFEDFLASALADGSLEAVLEDWSTRFSGPFLYYPSRRHMPAPLRAFIDFVRADRSFVSGPEVDPLTDG
jgi:DNA-binding transcriptional LysR family regulator